MTYVPNTQVDIIRPLQYTEEGTTQATFGVMPTSPTFVAAGINTDFNIDYANTKEDILALGNIDVQDMVKTNERNTFTLKSNISDTVLAKYGINTPVGAGTSGASVAFLFSYNVDGTETFQTLLGCKPISTTLSVDRGLWVLDQTWLAADITIPAAAAPAGATMVSTPTATILAHADSAADPFTWDSVTYDTSSFSITNTFDYGMLEVNGQLNIQHAIPSARRTTIDVEVYQKDDLLQADYDALTTITTWTMDLEQGTSLFTGTTSRIVDYDRPLAGSSTELIKEKISIETEAVELT